MVPYAPRPARPSGTLELAGFTLKRYDVHYADETPDASAYERGLAFATDRLPQPARTEARPGLGFCIRSTGRTGNYLILGWWDHRYELVVRCFTDSSGAWAQRDGTHSFCVWDLQVLWAEREAYVKHMMSDTPDVEAYLAEAPTVGA